VLDARLRKHYVVGNARVFDFLAWLPVGLRDRMVARALGLSALPAAG
jgi:hypothetical protein